MQAALILMTILGCDDSATQCHYVATVEQRWASVELCDAEAEKQLTRFSSVSYPTVVAVCQNPQKVADVTPKIEAPAAPQMADTETAPVPPVAAAEEPGLAARALTRVKSVLPTMAGVKTLVEKPVHFAADGYSWVARRFQK